MIGIPDPAHNCEASNQDVHENAGADSGRNEIISYNSSHSISRKENGGG